MKTIEVPYGRGIQTCQIPDDVECFYGGLSQVEPGGEPEKQIAAALNHMIGHIDLQKLRSANSVAIAVSDTTRPVPSRIIVETLLAWLEKYGITQERVTVLVGGGLHKPANSENLESILGQVLLNRMGKIVAHDADCEEDLAFLGTSSQGTPVYTNRYFAEADFKIVTGMVDAHQFMGFTAGVKGAVIGLGGRATITGNHSRLFQPGAELGHIDENPARMDLEDIGRIIGVDMIVNVVLNDKKKVVKAVAGHPVIAHRNAVEFAKKVFGVEVPRADIVIASPGGFPKDLNIYQAQKALTPAMQIVKPGGTIILVAQCIGGSGEEAFVREMSQYKNPRDVVDSFKQKEFVIGPHKAYLWSRTLASSRTFFVTDQVSADLAKMLMVDVRGTLQEAMDEVLLKNPESARITVLPYANSVIPIIKQ